MRHLTSVLAVASCGLLAACGGSEGAATAPTATQAAKPPRTPEQRLRAATAALEASRGFHIAGTQTDADGVARVEGDIRHGSQRILVRLKEGGSAEIRTVRSQVYVKADLRFYLSSTRGGATARLLADRWVTGPAEAFDPGDVGRFTPETLAYCLVRQHGTIKDAGTGSVAGRAVTRLRDRGDRPGTAPGILSVAARGTPFPVRLQQTGRKRPGGKRIVRCDGRKNTDTTSAQDLRISDFGADTPIAVPPNALDLDQLKQRRADASSA